eukprot:13087527-Alexandrium_andersonii.AAC.1
MQSSCSCSSSRVGVFEAPEPLHPGLPPAVPGPKCGASANRAQCQPRSHVAQSFEYEILLYDGRSRASS